MMTEFTFWGKLFFLRISSVSSCHIITLQLEVRKLEASQQGACVQCADKLQSPTKVICSGLVHVADTGSFRETEYTGFPVSRKITRLHNAA